MSEQEPSQQGEEAGPQVSFGDVFSTKKPKDAAAGLSSGLKSMAKVRSIVARTISLQCHAVSMPSPPSCPLHPSQGVVGGAVGLVALPAVGASQGGVIGFAKGLAAGERGSAWHAAQQRVDGVPCIRCWMTQNICLCMLPPGVAGAVIMPVTGIVVGTVQIGRGVANQPDAIVQSSKGKVWDEVRQCPGVGRAHEGGDKDAHHVHLAPHSPPHARCHAPFAPCYRIRVNGSTSRRGPS